MTASAQVCIKNGNDEVYLYTHWGSAELPSLVARALARRQRWTDPEYLARIIFDTMTEGYHGEEMGFGIGLHRHGDLDYEPIVVDVKHRTVTAPEMGTMLFTDYVLAFPSDYVIGLLSQS
jgi:hypothetical protein